VSSLNLQREYCPEDVTLSIPLGCIRSSPPAAILVLILRHPVSVTCSPGPRSTAATPRHRHPFPTAGKCPILLAPAAGPRRAPPPPIPRRGATLVAGAADNPTFPDSSPFDLIFRSWRFSPQENSIANTSSHPNAGRPFLMKRHPPLSSIIKGTLSSSSVASVPTFRHKQKAKVIMKRKGKKKKEEKRRA